MRACGTAMARRVSRPERISTAEGASAQPLRRHDSGSSHRAARVRPRHAVSVPSPSTASAHACDGTQGVTSASTRRASASVPTGSRVVSRCPSRSPAPPDPATFDPDPPPPDRPPPQRLHELERLDAVQRDRRGPQVGEPLLDPHAGAGVGEVEVAVDEQLLDPVEGDADRDRQQRGDAGQGQRPDAADPGPEQPEREERAEGDGRPVQDRRDEQPAVGHLQHRLEGRAGVGAAVAARHPARPRCQPRRPPRLRRPRA